MSQPSSLNDMKRRQDSEGGDRDNPDKSMARGERGDEVVTDRRDFGDATMAEGTRGDEVVTDVKDVPNIAKMGDGVNVTKIEELKNSNKNEHFKDDR